MDPPGNEATFGKTITDREPLRNRYPNGPYSMMGPVEVQLLDEALVACLREMIARLDAASGFSEGEALRCRGDPGAHSVTTMRLLLVAYPGAGKGTQAEKLAAHYGITHLSSGELLRAEVTSGTEIGKTAADFLKRGDLVPDELVFAMLREPLLEAAGHGGYVLDGFPRTLGQAEEAYSVAKELKDVELQAVVYLRVGHDELLKRLAVRSGQEARTDDDKRTIDHRFDVFESETEPLLDFYDRRGILLDINGEQSVEDVFVDITKAVDGLRV